MANPIRRLVQLVLDRNAAKKTEDAAKKSLGGVEAAMGRMRAAAVAIGAALAAAFGIRALFNFARGSIQAANEQEQAWLDLAGTIRSVGDDFDGMEAHLHAVATAFQEATTIGDEVFAGALRDLISISGDTSASLNNMGLVANVAAQFFKGDLRNAALLVGRVMNGEIGTLSRYGLKVQDAEEGLRVLAERSFGAAARQAESFGGKVQQLTNWWGDFREEIGFVLTQGDETAGLMDVLIGAVRAMTTWVQQNRDMLRSWVLRGLELAIDAVDVLWRTLNGIRQLIVGGFGTALGLAAQGTALLARGLALVVEAGAKASRFFGADELADRLEGFSDKIRDQAEALNEWGVAVRDAGIARVEAGLDTFGTRAFTGRQVLEGLARAGRERPEQPPELTAAPVLSKNAITEVTKAIEEYEKAVQAAAVLSATLGRDYSELGAEAAALTTLIKKLSDAGLTPADPIMQRYVQRLREVQQALKELNAADAFEDATRQAEAMAQVMGSQFDLLGAQAQSLQQYIQELVAAGVDPADERLQGLAMTLGLVQAQMDSNIDAADEFAGAIGAAMGAGIGPFAAGKARQNLIEAAELAVRAIVAGLNPFTAPQAGIYAAAAAKHTAIAAAWSALATSQGAAAGIVGGGGAGGGIGSRGLGLARGAGGASEETAPPGPEVHIHLVGPGFNALNPEVQRVVWGATEMAKERYGQNARIQLHGGR